MSPLPASQTGPSSNPFARYAGIFETLLFLAFWVAISAAVPDRLMRDPGTFWHTRIGLDILETGQLPQSDTYTYTRAGTPWICQFWICDLAMGGLYRLGGWTALLVVTAFVLAGTYAWLAGRFVAAGLDLVVTLLIVVLAIAVSAPQFHIRPLIFTITFLGLELVLLADVEAGRRRLVELWWMVPMFILWVNIHGGVIGGLASLALVTAGWLLLGLMRWDSPIRNLRDAGHLVAISLSCALTVLVNPYGLRMPQLWLDILGLPLSEFVMEHAPLWHKPVMALPAVALLLVYLLFLFSTSPRKWRATWLLPLVWFLLACQRNRHAALFSVAVLAVLVDVLPQAGFSRLLQWRELYFPCAADHRNGPPAWPRWALMGVLLLVALGLQGTGIPVPLLGADAVQLKPSYWPVALLPELRELEKSPTTRLFNNDLNGGFLIFHTPGLPVFIDDRCELFGEQFLRRYFEIATKNPAKFDELDAEYHFTHALVKRRTPIDEWLRTNAHWKLLGETPSATLFEKVGPSQAAVAPASWSYPRIRLVSPCYALVTELRQTKRVHRSMVSEDFSPRLK